MKYFLISFTLFFSINYFGQEDFFFLKFDTIKLTSRIGGDRMDSIADYNNGLISLNPGGYKLHPFGEFQNKYIHFLDQTFNQFSTFERSNFKYSSLPHLGFHYSFGSKGIQMLHADYEQFFSKKFGLNVLIDRSSIGEMIRRGSYKNNKIIATTYFRGRRYKNYMSLTFSNSFIDENGGLDTTTSVMVFPLEFLTVNKSNAHSDLKNFKVSSQHYFNFLNDSVKDFGVVIKNDWKINHRVYKEKDILSEIYKKIYIDSFETRDQFQFSRLDSYAGFYKKTKTFFSEILVSHAYWNFKNLSNYLDTNEFSLNLNLGLDIKHLKLSNKSYYNLVGAKGEWFSKFRLSSKINTFQTNAYFDVEEKLPTIFQRKYFSNNNSWMLSKIEVQKSLKMGLSTEYPFKKDQLLKFSLDYASYQKSYFFVDSTWKNDTLTKLFIFSCEIKANFRYKSLLFQPYVILNSFSNHIDYIPKIDFRTRIAFNKKLFKAKKLDFIFAADFSYQGSRKLMAYMPNLDLFVLTNSNHFSNSNLYKIDLFTAFQIDKFRFYVKTENLNYLWNKSDSYIFRNIPITPFLIRLGLTWDFFN